MELYEYFTATLFVVYFVFVFNTIDEKYLFFFREKCYVWIALSKHFTWKRKKKKIKICIFDIGCVVDNYIVAVKLKVSNVDICVDFHMKTVNLGRKKQQKKKKERRSNEYPNYPNRISK